MLTSEWESPYIQYTYFYLTIANLLLKNIIKDNGLRDNASSLMLQTSHSKLQFFFSGEGRERWTTDIPKCEMLLAKMKPLNSHLSVSSVVAGTATALCIILYMLVCLYMCRGVLYMYKITNVRYVIYHQTLPA